MILNRLFMIANSLFFSKSQPFIRLCHRNFVPLQRFLTKCYATMKVKVNTRTLQLFDGACVRNALLRYFTVKKLDKQLIDEVEVHDAFGHVIDHDAPLSDGQQITFEPITVNQ